MMNKIKTRKVKGFTIIELVVVISIIAILSGISIFALNEARESGRNAKRRSDLAQIATALEMLKADCNFYPNTIPVAESKLTGSCNTNVYLEVIPDDPVSTNNYKYFPLPDGCTSTSTCTKFELWTAIEPSIATPTYCDVTPTAGDCGSDCNFCIINP